MVLSLTVNVMLCCHHSSQLKDCVQDNFSATSRIQLIEYVSLHDKTVES